MTVLVNVMMLVAVVLPLAVAFGVWKRWTDPSASFARSATKLDREIQRAVDQGEMSRAHRLAQSWTVLMRSKQPDTPEYVVPELRDLYDSMPMAD